MEDGPIDRLFTLPLAEFVAERNALAKAIKVRGDKETAARVAKLPKPSISCWAINQLVRRDRDLITALLDALDRQRGLQLAGLGAEVDRTALKEAKQAENDALKKIERALPPVLESDGHASGRNTIERCVRSIRAAAVHAEGRELLENGHLTVDFDTPGFEAFGASIEETPKLRLIDNAIEEKRRLEAERVREVKEREERKKERERERIEAQERIEAERRKIEEERRRFEEQRKLAEERRKLEDERRKIDEERRKEEQRKRAEEQRRVDEAAKQKADLERSKQNARLGEAAKILSSLRIERAKIEEQVEQLEDQVEKARVALERAQRDAAKAKEELDAKTSQISKLEQMLGLFDEEEE